MQLRLALALLVAVSSPAALAGPVDPLDEIAAMAPSDTQLAIVVQGGREVLGALAPHVANIPRDPSKTGGYDLLTADGWRKAGFDLGRPTLVAARALFPSPRIVAFLPVVDERAALESVAWALGSGKPPPGAAAAAPIPAPPGPQFIDVVREPRFIAPNTFVMCGSDGSCAAYRVQGGYLHLAIVDKGNDKDALDALGGALAITPARSLATVTWWKALRSALGGGHQLFVASGPGLPALALASLGPNPLNAGMAARGVGGAMSVTATGGMHFAMASLDDASALADRVAGARAVDDFAGTVAGKLLFDLRVTPTLDGRTLEILLAIPAITAAMDSGTAAFAPAHIDFDLRRDLVPALGPHPSLTILGLDAVGGLQDPKRVVLVAALRFRSGSQIAALVEKKLLPMRADKRLETVGQDGIVWYTRNGVAMAVIGDRLVLVRSEGASALAAAHALLASDGARATALLPRDLSAATIEGPSAFFYATPEAVRMLDPTTEDNPNPLMAGPSDFRLGRRADALVLQCNIDGDVVALSVTAFRRYIRRAEQSEARNNVAQLVALATAYWAMERAGGPKLPPSAPWTPAASACRQPEHKYAPDPRLWATAGWTALGFRVDEPSRFQYRVVTGKTTVDVEARGDLDCDGKPLTFRAHGHIDANHDLLFDPVAVDGEE